jgi:7,8-dihydropterin-6-yl-methyl-4-(beta-D-ribofuranosyl)aminobenzene 5'-phosphate synthase
MRLPNFISQVPSEGAFSGRKTIVVKDPVQIRENIFSTGELEGVEQSLALKTAKGVFVVTACAHSGMHNILIAAAKLGELHGVAGGFHGFDDFRLFQGLSLICPCRCTKCKREKRDLFGDRALQCGVWSVIELWGATSFTEYFCAYPDDIGAFFYSSPVRIGHAHG